MTANTPQGAAAQTELEQQAENAARYLWLRNNAKASDWDDIADQMHFLNGTDLDKFVDSGRAVLVVRTAPGSALDRARQAGPDLADLSVRWDLYRSCEGAEAAEAKLNQELRRLLGLALCYGDLTMSRAEKIRDHMYWFMDQFVSLGARDTEPEVALVETIEKFIPAAKGLTR